MYLSSSAGSDGNGLDKSDILARLDGTLLSHKKGGNDDDIKAKKKKVEEENNET